ncbi:MAG TPA: hypothetical protein EYG74_07910 [Sulfurimonas autotrophica]|nr:hypothetical protein [Sulfurimonas autotrophica]
MLILSIIGIIVGIVLIYGFIIEVNRYTEKTYSYEFFNFANYSISAAGYVLIYYGYNWYEKALNTDQDILNGIILVGIGIILIGFVLYFNIKNTSIKLSILFSPIQQVLYAVFALFGLLAIVLMIAYFAQTKPVFNIRGR